MICLKCHGNGYWIEKLRVLRQVRQCEICNSSGEVKESKDANASLRDLMKREGILDYDDLKAGDKVTLKGLYSDGTEATISAYRAKTRGDKRIWFNGLKNHAESGDVMALVIRGGKMVIQNITKGVAMAVFLINPLENIVRNTF